MLIARFRVAAALMAQAKVDVLKFRSSRLDHWRKIWSANTLESLTGEIKRRIPIGGIFPNAAAIIHLVGALLLEQQEEWQWSSVTSSLNCRWPNWTAATILIRINSQLQLLYLSPTMHREHQWTTNSSRQHRLSHIPQLQSDDCLFSVLFS